MEIKKGSIVKATAGKEKDRFMLVIEMEEDFLFLVDGKRRKFLSPKRKNRKHVSPTHHDVDLSLAWSDKKLRRFLQDWNEKGQKRMANGKNTALEGGS